ncbi:B12-binding domain-containing radical SAM protein [Porphyromonadaceae bacterium OttesenSCG-928-L07]|nr:B12-binding domain-containing radical SAM protein [Porphyromonadaceae bacterium OttesenSCG-928-L07]MDL2251359.1 B12-binding domain-containing radical SAM protein [Odoribacter sp. OttesenSCG-928-J03]MDL2283234.1 B12-binding domain-containing radical SAM protein [Odoribacter sp. OttesenSCG-928-G04]
MKTILTTLNAKYIHTSLALRLLYVANREHFDISFKEFTIKEKIEKIADDLLVEQPDVIGISVYIWNVEQIRKLVCLLKERKPGLVVVLGGPEVTYDAEHFLQDKAVDFVVKGEGEFVLGELLSALEKGEEGKIKGVSSIKYPDQTVVKADLKQLEQLPSPYMLKEDIGEIGNRLVYFESSRGCPYQCGYCLSSLESGVRYYSREYIHQNLRFLLDNGARQIKFLDRTFNMNEEHTRSVFDFLISNHRPGLSCQFEIYADLLTDEMIDYLNTHLPDNYFRFEIGIQSTHEPTNVAVKRRQDFRLLADNIRKLAAGKKIDMHLDLIAGLPYENFERFVQSFNDVFRLQVKEVQLGFLKLLRGTSLRRDADKYGYEYNQQAPYEIESNHVISKQELERIHDAEHALEKYWNSGRFKKTMEILVNDYYTDRYFELFDEIGQFYNDQKYPHHAYQLEDIYRNLHDFLLSKGINLFEALRTDYYANFKIRPHGFWEPELEKKRRKQLLYQVAQDKSFLEQYGLSRRIIEKQAVIDPDVEGGYLLTIFFPEGPQAYTWVPES